MTGGLVDSYLTLTAQEMQQYERELTRFTPTERKDTMEIMTSWHREGRAEGITQGITQGKEMLVMRQLRRRFGAVSEDVTARLEQLSPEQIDDLGEALLDFGAPADLDQWLSQH